VETPSGPLILIVDDEEIGRHMLRRLLENEGYHVECAENGSAGIEKARTLVPDLILLDVVMPVIDGYEVCEILRRDPDLAEVPVIMLTSLDDTESRLRGLEAGADDFLSKPVQPEELRARARTVTRLNRYRRLRTERARFGWVVENADEGYLLVSEAGTVLYANGKAKKFLGLAQGAEGRDVLDLLKRRYRLRPPERWSSWPDLPTDETLHLLRPESSRAPAVWLAVRTQAHDMGDRREFLLQLRDVTQERATQRCVWTFESLVSHKLRTPLTKISLGLSVIEKKASKLTREKIQEFAGMANEGVADLKRQLEGVLGYINAPTAIPEGDGFPLSELEELMAEVLAQLELSPVVPLMAEKLPSNLYLSHQAVELILLELCQNSKKFHPENTPRLEVRVRPAGDRVVLEVEDDGVSLTPEQMHRALQPYYQGERSFTGQVHGMGLGLPLVCSMIWEVGGECSLRNREDGDGVVVELRIPTTRVKKAKVLSPRSVG
jgi:two-component system cell cycle response regulator